jgi:hypothetical protein
MQIMAVTTSASEKFNLGILEQKSEKKNGIRKIGEVEACLCLNRDVHVDVPPYYPVDMGVSTGPNCRFGSVFPPIAAEARLAETD